MFMNVTVAVVPVFFYEEANSVSILGVSKGTERNQVPPQGDTGASEPGTGP